MKFLLQVLFFSAILSNVYAAEPTQAQAEHRIPPVLYSIDIPHTIIFNKEYTFKWSVIGYHEDYVMDLSIKTGNAAVFKLDRIEHIIDKKRTGKFKWGNIDTTEYFFEATGKVISKFEYNKQNLQIRFFISPPNDEIDTTYLSCLIPNGLGYRTDTTSGRSISVTGVKDISKLEKVNDVFLNSDGGMSYVASPGGVESGWKITTGSTFHEGVDKNSDDWNWGSGTDDNGKKFYSGISGEVIFTGLMYDKNKDNERFTNSGDAWFGNQVIVYNEQAKMAMRYAHLSEVDVKEGNNVYVGQQLGKVGNTGKLPKNLGSMSPHLHMTLYKNIEHSKKAYERLSKGWTPQGIIKHKAFFGYVGDK